MKKSFKQLVALVLVLFTMTSCISVFGAEGYRTLYTEDGMSKDFPVSQVSAQLTVGWYTEPVQRLYAEGKSKVFPKSQVAAQVNVGWYTYPVQRLYAPGKSKVFPKSQVAAQLKVGWYAEPLTLMYALDGRSKYVVKSQVAANKNVGWYVGKPVKVYAEGGKTKYISAEDIAANEKVGWYTEPVTRLYAPGKSKVFKNSQVQSQINVGWYTYPVTKLYGSNGASKVVKTSEVAQWTAKGWKTTDPTLMQTYPEGNVISLDKVSGVKNLGTNVHGKRVYYRYPASTPVADYCGVLVANGWKWFSNNSDKDFSMVTYNKGNYLLHIVNLKNGVYNNEIWISIVDANKSYYDDYSNLDAPKYDEIADDSYLINQGYLDDGYPYYMYKYTSAEDVFDYQDALEDYYGWKYVESEYYPNDFFFVDYVYGKGNGDILMISITDDFKYVYITGN